ncbi:hypothetical protein [Streptomyces sp. NPDC001502]|uniref:hypothetical protein n=1 Tax=Streptomyces sp. NPDC001502 TaxID=3364578 RepID=UPI00367EDFD4
MRERARCESSRKHGKQARRVGGRRRLIFFLGAAVCAALTLGRGALLAGPLQRC